MNQNELKQKTVSGFVYKFLERAGAKGISFIISLILARLLMPEDYGIIALVTVLIQICDVFVTYGFGNSLIVNKKSDSLDFSTCFYFGLGLSFVVYIGIYYFAPIIADFYEMEILIKVLRVMGLRVPIAAINSVQHAYVSKHMDFKKFFIATSIGTIISGIIAVIMAYCGFGIWALVSQYLTNVLIDTICLFFIIDWRPTLEFSFRRLKKIYAYGWKILVVGLIDTIFIELRSLIIGKKYTKIDLAYYNRGNQFPSLAMSLIEPTVNGVLFPALSLSNDNQIEMKNIARRVIKVSTYIIFPIMIGLIVIAKPLVIFLLTEKWLPAVIYLQVACLAQMFRPLQFINNSIIKASGQGGLLLKLNIIKKTIGIALLIFSMNYGVIGIAISLVIINIISTFINIMPNRKLLNYGYIAQFTDIFKSAISAIIMGIVVYFVSFLPLTTFGLLIVQIFIGMFFYIMLSIICKIDSFEYLLYIIRKNILKRK